ncbi:MAG: hypothetical protein A2161_12495 [Candidatus Schekmanbacteria bacterium RBG_13_48_7]|uniref:Uncharacterized protein n=1 Tax=Candidatus Schekmanbacteria bacterium RBG_13_48_7 TaxID=1817878 RepID=A0A1F7S0F8_9BACT|nr:MAG: hypothetical protein A2161_12495 [Candidatus Schekmanbacteria bacterium RBG_13_48_7]
MGELGRPPGTGEELSPPGGSLHNSEFLHSYEYHDNPLFAQIRALLREPGGLYRGEWSGFDPIPCGGRIWDIIKWLLGIKEDVDSGTDPIKRITSFTDCVNKNCLEKGIGPGHPKYVDCIILCKGQTTM